MSRWVRYNESSQYWESSTNAGSSFASLVESQIKFPATQNSSSNANTLDDYEEGTWTPILGGSVSESGQSYSGQVGYYTKVGNLVTAWGDVSLSNKGTITGHIHINNLPFTCLSSQHCAISIGYFYSLNTSFVYLCGHVDSDSTGITLYGLTAAGVSVATLASSDLTNTSRFIFKASYRG